MAMVRLFRKRDARGRPVGVFYAWGYDAHGKRWQRSTMQLDKHAAEQVARQWEQEGVDPKARSERATVGEAIDLFLASIAEQARAGQKSAATVRVHTWKAKQLRELIGATTLLAQLTPGLIDAYVTKRRAMRLGKYEQKPVSQHTIYKELGTLSALLKHARRQGLYHGDPAAVLPIGFAQGYTPRTRALSADELPKLLNELPPDKSARLAFIAVTGARLGETNRARREDIAADLSYVILRGTKTKLSARTVPILSSVRDMLSYVLEHAEGEGGALFNPWRVKPRLCCWAAQPPFLIFTKTA